MVEGLIDKVRDFWDRMPCDIGRSDWPVGSCEYFDELEGAKYEREPHIPAFAQFTRWRGRRVLEIGCGLGCDTASFAKAGANVTAVDLSRDSIMLARERLNVLGLPGVALYEGDAEFLTDVLPRKARYDLIYSFGVIHHTPHPRRVLRQILYCCHRDTEVRIMLYAKWSARAFHKLIFKGKGRFWRFSEILRENAEAQYGCPVAYYYSFREVRKLLEGYEILRLQKANLGSAGWRLSDNNPLARMFGSHLLITARRA